MTIDLIEAYGNRLIENLDKYEILEAIRDGSVTDITSSYGSNNMAENKGISFPVGYDINGYADCVCKYFKPEKSYWKLSVKDSCKKIKEAFGISSSSHSCTMCFMKCINNNEIITTGRKRRQGDNNLG